MAVIAGALATPAYIPTQVLVKFGIQRKECAYMYAKIYNQILDSSIVEDHQVRYMFMDLLVLCDSEGEVDMTLQSIARRINVPLEQVRRTMKVLEQPDQSSRTKAEGGRRIVLLDDHRDWGWRIVNHAAYRSIKNNEEKREHFRSKRKKTIENAHENEIDATNSLKQEQLQVFECTDASVEHELMARKPLETNIDTSAVDAELAKSSASVSVSASVVVLSNQKLPTVSASASRRRASDAEKTLWFKSEFWVPGVVWQKVGHGPSLEKWKQKVSTRADADRIIEAARAQGPGILQHAISNNHSVLHPATWLNQDRFMDDPQSAFPLPSQTVQNGPQARQDERNRMTIEQARRQIQFAAETRAAAMQARRNGARC